MGIQPQNGSTTYTVTNYTVYQKWGTSMTLSTSASASSGYQLAQSTNTTQGYFVGQMLAKATGLTSTGTSSGLTADAYYNYNPSSTDTGQKVWKGHIIVDNGLPAPLSLSDLPDNLSLEVAIPNAGWIIRQQYLYANGTPATDTSIVAAALTTYGQFTNFPVSNESTSSITELAFSY